MFLYFRNALQANIIVKLEEDQKQTDVVGMEQQHHQHLHQQLVVALSERVEQLELERKETNRKFEQQLEELENSLKDAINKRLFCNFFCLKVAVLLIDNFIINGFHKGRRHIGQRQQMERKELTQRTRIVRKDTRKTAWGRPSRAPMDEFFELERGGVEYFRMCVHEIGHTLCHWFVADAERFTDCTIIPNEQFDGATFSEEKERYSLKELKARMAVLFGGKIAELEFFSTAVGIDSDRHDLIEDVEKVFTSFYKMCVHEIGHTLCHWFVADAERFTDCTIIPNEQFDGATFSEEKERYSLKELKARMAVLFGGKIAELEFFSTAVRIDSDRHDLIEDVEKIVERNTKLRTRLQRRKARERLLEEAEKRLTTFDGLLGRTQTMPVGQTEPVVGDAADDQTQWMKMSFLKLNVVYIH
uniref:Peptidase M41 domain-containing protein n=1 Tax=Globodera rostochiensis TaxID=31243 RepID=A0A914HNN7_GLORO